MARSDPQVNLRLPETLKQQLDEAAHESGRSLTAEVVMRLTRTFSEDPAINGISFAEVFRKLEELQAMIASGEFVPFSQTESGKAWAAKHSPKPGAKRKQEGK